VRTIKLNTGNELLVDDEDFEWVSKYRWFEHRNGYVRRNHTFTDGVRRSWMIHRAILNAPKGTQVDHINGNKLDNRRENLRLATPAENTRNRKPPKYNTTGYKGVCPGEGRFKSYIQVSGKQAHLGYFDTAEDAARMYNFWAKDIYGEFAWLNKIKS
jgi:hypothetical protein